MHLIVTRKELNELLIEFLPDIMPQDRDMRISVKSIEYVLDETKEFKEVRVELNDFY